VSARYQGLAAVAAAMVVIGLLGGAVGVAATPAADQVATNETATNETRAPHQDPDEIQQEGDSQRVAEYLSARLGERLRESAVAVSEENLERGVTLLGDGYDEDLAKYATMAEDLDKEELATQFNLTREQQASLVATLRETDTLATEYQVAVRNGNDEQARELARELLSNAEEINRTTGDLERRYEILENETTIDLGEAEVSIEEIRRQTGEAAAAITAREFAETSVVAEANRTRISADTPTQISGRVTTADGTPIENGSIRVQLGEDTVTTDTTENGTFTAPYRPLLAPVNASNVTVTYEPDPTDPYLPATDTVAVSITEQAATSIDLANATATTAFDEPVRATGTVRVAGVDAGAIDGIPVALSVDGRQIATGVTGANGDVELVGTLPSTVSPGASDLEVRIDRRDAAIAPSTAEATLSVRETPTALAVDAAISETAADGEVAEEVAVSGRLAVDDANGADGGTALAGQVVALSIDGTDLGTVETDANGTYRTTVAIPASAADGRLTVTAAFDGTGTNLGGSTAESEVVVPQPNAADGGTSDVNVRSVVVAGSLTVLLIVAAYVVARRRNSAWLRWLRATLLGIKTESAASGSAGAAASGVATVGERTSGSGDESTEGGEYSRSPLTRARSELAAGRPDEAAKVAYAVVRSRLSRSSGDPSSETHWEFYRRWRDDGRVDEGNLRTVTESYETAAFAPDEVPSQAADDAVTASDDILDPGGAQTDPNDG